MGTQVAPEKGTPTTPTQFLAHVYCVQMAGWIKMPLGTKVNLGPGDVVLDGLAAPLKSGTAPSFRFTSIVANGWMDEDATWYVSRPRPRFVLDGVPALRERGTAAPPLFGSCLLLPRSTISATAELLLHFA